MTSQPIPFVTLLLHITSHLMTADALCSNLAKFACANIDIEKQLELAQRLLEALIGNSIKKHPRQITGEVRGAVGDGRWEGWCCAEWKGVEWSRVSDFLTNQFEKLFVSSAVCVRAHVMSHMTCPVLYNGV
jgi:hypothetical protein